MEQQDGNLIKKEALCFFFCYYFLKLYLKDFSELDNVKMASATKEEQDKKIITMKERIKAMLDKVDPATDTSAFAKYAECNDTTELTNIGIAVKKLVEQGA